MNECPQCESALLIAINDQQEQCPNCKTIFNENGTYDYDIIRDIIGE